MYIVRTLSIDNILTTFLAKILFSILFQLRDHRIHFILTPLDAVVLIPLIQEIVMFRLFSRRQRTSSRKVMVRFRPQVESLEGRVVPTLVFQPVPYMSNGILGSGPIGGLENPNPASDVVPPLPDPLPTVSGVPSLPPQT